MSNTVLTVKVEVREELGSANSRRLRRDGRVPAVVYGHGGAASPLVVKAEDLPTVLHHSGLLTLDIAGGQSKSAILKEVQQHPIRNMVLHIDFQEVKADEQITSHARIEPVGTPAGATHGGQLEQILHEVEIQCLPTDMVDVIEVDVSGLEVDDTMHLRELAIPEGVEVMADPELPVFQVRIPRIEVEDEEAEAEETTPTADEAGDEDQE